MELFFLSIPLEAKFITLSLSSRKQWSFVGEKTLCVLLGICFEAQGSKDMDSKLSLVPYVTVHIRVSIGASKPLIPKWEQTERIKFLPVL